MNDQDLSPELNGFAEVQSWLIARVAELGELDPQAIDPRERLSHYGLGSLASVRLLADLSAALGRPLPATLIWEQPTIEALSRYVAREGGELSPPRGKGASAAATLEPIAIVGLSCRFPKAPNAAAFWKLLRDGVDATTEVPSDRWDVDALYDADRSAPGKMITRRAGFLEQVDGFDPLFFGISPREAREMDPQQRLMLELVWEALEDAGLPAAKLAGSRTGIFVGAIWHDYADLVSGQFESMTGIRATGQALNMIANRVSYALDLQGPSVVMDTACSSSLVAIHLACQSLWYGDTTLALAGGVNLILAPDTMVALSKFGGLSPSGRSKAFDASADGFGRGEGAGVVVLKPLSKAIADGDPIRCVIRATAVNNDGLSNGLTAPNPAAQEDVLREAYRRARLEPSQVHYVEAHGTGTALGDPIEAKALGRVLGEGRPADRPLYIGSVKTNIGHLEGAAGIAGLIKTILAIEHQEIPPSLHFEQPNPHIPFDELRLKVPQALEPWPASAEPALAAVSSFGWGGTNAHIVIEGQPRGELDWLALSAESTEALEARVGEVLASAELGAQSRSTLGIPSSIGASPHRLAVGFRSRAELEEHLRAFLRGQPQAGLAFGRAPDGGRKLVFVCSPQGPQWVGMGRTLMRREPVFRGVLEQCDRELSRYTGWSLLDELFADEPNARFDDVDVIQPILVCVQIALAAQWRAWGVEPAAVVGHSLGEVSAACIAGILDLKDAIRIIYHYSRCQKLTANQGGMALVELPADELQRLIDDSQGRISLAGYNSPRSTVLSGEPAALGAALDELKQRGVRCALIKVNVAAHSPQMDAIQEELTAALSGIQPRRATIPMFSTLTGEVLSGHEIDPSYFPRNLRQPVRLAQVMDRLLADGFDVFVELSPQPALTYALQQSVKSSGREAMVFASLERANEEDAPLFDTRAKLYALGIPGEPTQGGATPASSREELLVLSARSSAALREMARATSSWIEERSDLRLQDLCYTASVRRSHHDHRLSVVGSSGEEIAAALSAFCREEPQASVATGQVQPWARPKVVFVYPGQGSQWAGMGRALLATEPVFRATLEACDTLVRRYAGFSLMDELLAPEETSRLEETEVAQPALFAIEVALSALFASWGVRPDAVIGHSVGEVAAAHVAGALSLPEAVRLVCLRGRVMQRATGLGKMAAVALPEAEARRALEGHENLLSIAAVNDPGSVVLSGEAVALEQVLTQLRQQNVRCRMLPVNYAFHSQQMDVFAGELGQTLGALETRPAELVMYSSVSGAGVPGEALDAAYWARNVREPVQFARAIETAFGEGHRIFVEVGPHPVLAGHLEQCLHGHAERGQVLATLRRQREERRSVLSALGALYAAGSHVDWAPLFPWGGLCVPLPTYPWQREHYWIEAGRAARGLTSTGHPLLGARVPVAGTSTVFEAALGLAAAPYLVDHRVYDQLVVPGAGVLELALAAAVAQDGAQPYRLQGLVIQSPLVVPERGERRLQVVVSEATAEGAAVSVYSQPSSSGPGEPWTEHAMGHLCPRPEGDRKPAIDFGALRARCHTQGSAAAFYGSWREFGFGWGPGFQAIVELWRGEGETLSRIELPAEAGGGAEVYGIHPVLLDAALQTLVAELTPEMGGELYLPFEVNDFLVERPGASAAWVLARRTGTSREIVSGDVTVMDERGEVLVQVTGVRLKRAQAAMMRQAEVKALPTWLYELTWPEVATAKNESVPQGTWLVLTEGSALGDTLTRQLVGVGARAIVLALGDVIAQHSAEGVREALLSRCTADAPLEGVVCVWGTAGAPEGEGTPADRAHTLTTAALHLAQALTSAGAPKAARLLWVTQGAQAVHAGETATVAEAPLWGLGRVLMDEHPELGCKLVDLEPGAAEGAEALWRELCAADDETQVAWRAGKRHGARLSRAATARGQESAPDLVAQSTVLITGGLGGLGLQVARWLWEKHQIQHLLLVGRSAPVGERLAAVEALRAQGARVTVAQADVADAAAVRALLGTVPPELPLSGVIHAAGIVDRGMLTQQDAARFAHVLAAKVHGAWNLHVETRALPLRFFVMFSSVASVLGFGGLSSYAAGNAFLDALAHERKTLGLAGQSLNWGPWAEGGMGDALDGAQRTRLSRQGIGLLSPAEGLDLLERALGRSEAELCVLPLDLKAVRQSLGSEVPPLWRTLLVTSRARAAVSSGWAAQLAALSPEARRAEVETAVKAEVAKVLGLAASNVGAGRPLHEMGLDSMMAVELRNALSARSGKSLPATLVFDYPTVTALVRHLIAQLVPTENDAPKRAAMPQLVQGMAAEPIAIVGIGCRYPGGANDLEGFWRLLEQGVDAMEVVPRDRWDVNAYYDPDPDAPGKMLTRLGGFLRGIDQFDAGFFGIAPREAVKMDPHQRILLEVSWEALERAGQTADRLLGSDTGVFVGLMYHDYEMLSSGTLEQLDGYTVTGFHGSVASGRISYLLGLQGPSMTLDTACSSSLVAVHLACQSLRRGECSMALAGGATVMLTPLMFVEFSRLRGLSPEGRCKTFSETADGVAWGEGCGMLVLKRLSDAQRDGDPILALIRGTAVNQDGRSNGLTAPNGPSQEAVIRRALAEAGVAPSFVDYVEAHGTGTPLGDPIEAQSLGAVLREGRAPERPVLVGSVKSNFGHTQAAAGVAGLIKVVACLQHELIPRSLHFTKPNPRVAWSDLLVKVASEPVPWPAQEKTRVAGASSFGASGTNAHVVMAEAPRVEKAEPLAAEASCHLLPLSAKTPEALSALATSYIDYLATSDARPHDIAYTASVRRTHHEHRLAAAFRSKEELAAALSAFARGEAKAGLSQGKVAANAPKVVFVFPGQGSQWVGMGRALLAEEPVFRAALEACDQAITREAGFSVLEELRAEESQSRFTQIDILQPTLFAISVALAALWRSYGVTPDAVVGHSMGEVAAAHVAGALRLEEAVQIVCRRSRLLRGMSNKGAMALVELSLAEAQAELRDYASRVFVAGSNSPRTTVLSGEPEALEELLDRLDERGVFCGWGMADVASHTPMMASLRGDILSALADLSPSASSIPMYSTVSTRPIEGSALRATYWADNLEQPVLFSQTVQRLLGEGYDLFVEVSPHPILVPAIEDGLKHSGHEGAALASLRREQDERHVLFSSLGALHARGYVVAWERLYPSRGRCVPLPAYPWQRQRFWVDAARTSGPAKAPPSSLYQPVWQVSERSRGAEPKGSWLVLTNGGALGRALTQRLASAGVRCFTVGLGKGATKEGADLWVEEPSAPGVFAPALAAAEAMGSPLQGVVCVWGAERASASEGTPADESLAVTAAALSLVHTLTGRDAAVAPSLWWVTEGAVSVRPGDSAAPAEASLWGLGRVLMAEHPELGCTLVDLEPGAPDGSEALWSELCAADDETQAAWRGGERYVARLIEAAPLRARQATPRIVAESTVLITGGLGGLGLVTANWLWEEHHVQHLVLVGRSAPDGERLAAVEALRAQGARVTVAQADVTDRAAVRALLEAIPEELPLRGVIHAACVLDDGVLAQQTPERFARVLSPKVRGAWNLHLETRALPLQFFVMFSSASSVLGVSGQSNYAAANAFLDALAHERRAEGLCAQSLNFGPWRDEGMAKYLTPVQRTRLERLGLEMLSTVEGVELLGQAISRPEAQLCVMPLNLKALEQASQGGVVLPLWRALVAPAPMLPTQAAQPVQAAKGSFAGRLLALAPETRLAAMQTMVRAEVAKVLGASDAAHVPNDRALQELGFGSLMVLELRNALAAQVNKALPATLVFNYPSVEALARYLLDQVELAPAAARETVAVSTPVATTSDEPIAIVGIGCRYPGGVRDPESYWRLLEQEIDAIGEVPRDRWDIDAYYDPDPDAPGKMVTRWGGFIEGLDQFDPSFFEISPREAMGLDPQQRILLEVTWEALERAGQTKERLWGSDTAVYMGMLTDEYRTLAETQTGTLDPYVFLGTMHSTSVARLSYWLGLQGPNMALDTACSASLVAVHLACQSLRSGESSLALAGGVNVLLDPEVTVCLSGMRAMSPTGRCHTFSADADGIVRSDGCGVVVLKRLSDAQRDGDPILAVIRGSAVNQDGRSNGLTAPNGRAQEAVIRRALAQAGVAPSAVSYVEVHGTGTPLGDPIEVQALAAVLREGRSPDEPFTIGSVKTNFGHTEGAAGVGSLIKAVLMLQRGAIPKSLHFTAPNPHIPWAELPVKVATEAAPWNGNGRPRIAGVSSFGLSGTNAHVVLEEAPRPGREVAAVEASTVLLPLSAKSPEALMALAEEYRSWLTQNTSASLHDVAYTASERRTHHAHRLAVVGSREELCTALEALGRGEPGLGMVRGDAPAGARPKVVFVFPGQGTQWVGMARQLFDEEAAFRDALVACDEAIRRETSFSVIDVLRADDAEARFGALEVVQPVLFAIEVALAALWRSWGVEPDAVVGHSMGEVAAAYVAGALSLPDAAAVICRRSRLFLQVRGQGAMAMVELPLAEARQEIQGYASRVFIAASNSPRMTVLSGELEALEELLDRLEERGVFCGWGMADVASHSPQMAGLLDELRATLTGLTPTSASLPMWSTVTGERVRGDELRADYWADNLSQPVLFSQVIGGLIEESPCLFVEISPHPVLLPSVEEHLHERKAQGAAVASLRRQVDERRSLLEAAGKLYVHGYPVAWARLYPSAGPCVSLPTYPFQRQRCWIDTAASMKGGIERPRLSRAGGVAHPLLGASFTVVSQPDAHFWEQAISVEALPYLAEHRVEGEVVVPGAAYTEMALAAAVELYGEGAHDIHDIVFERMLILPPEGARIIQVMLTEQGPGQSSLQISSREPADNTWVQHATASVRVGESVPKPMAAGETLDAIRERCPASVSRDEHYQRIAARRIDFGARFQGVEQLWVGTGEVLGRVRLPDEGAKEASAYQVHPAFLDACFQVLGGLLSGQEAAGAIVPVGLSRVRLERRPGREVWVHGRRQEAQGGRGEGLIIDLRILDDDGQLVGEVEGLWVKPLSATALGPRARYEAWLHELTWLRRDQDVAAPAPKASPSAGAFLLWMDQGQTGQALAALLHARGEACVRVVAGARYERLGEGEYQVDPSDPESYRAVLRDAFGKERPCRGIVHLWSLDAITAADTSAEALLSAQQRSSVSALYLAQALLRMGLRDLPRLLLVTRGAQVVGADTGSVEVAQAPLWGLGRTLGMEHPELGCTRVDLSPTPEAEEASSLWRELLASDGEDQVALRDGGRYVARLVHGSLKPSERRAILRPDSSYLLIGGLGGLGLSLAAWMVQNGARHLVLVGRNGPSEAARASITDMEAIGATVLTVQADVSRKDDLERALAEVASRMPKLAGVVHAAVVLDDRTALELSQASFDKVMAPKVQGAWNLHVLTRDMPLDFFVMYSSGASLFGSPGQGNYAAANAFLDALAHHRTRLGLPGLSINWGPFSEVGLSAAQQNRGARLSYRGVRSISPAQGHEVLERLLAAEVSQVGVIDLNVRQWLEFYPGAAAAPVWSELKREGQRAKTSGEGTARALQILAKGSAGERPALLSKHLREELGQILRLPPSQIDPQATFSSLGVDSLMSLEFRNRLEVSLELKLSAAMLFTYPSVVSLAEHLLGRLKLSPEQPIASPEKDTRAATTRGILLEKTEPIAIIGVGCRFPGGATSPEAFWRLLQQGGDAVVEVPAERWSLTDTPSNASPEARAVRWGAFLKDVDLFDPQFFGISPREAVSLDPQQRLLLEVAWEALEYAGQVPSQLFESRTGVFVGITTNDYAEIRAAADGEAKDVYDVTGNGHCFPPGRLSYVLGLQGPSMAVDTACSSSLVAIHLACQSLRSGESTLALAGGVNLMLSAALTDLVSKTGALSPDGRCKAFDAQANGFVRGEGCGVVVLKRLSDALADGDRILALIRGSAVNQDGRSTGLTAPNVLSQQALLRQALESARVSPAEIGYVETHGTGTSLGDPIEIEALSAVLGAPRPDGSVCALGAVKTNLGHLEAAAGVAGLIKAVLALQHRKIPSNLHYKTLNPRISLDGTSLIIAKEELAWKANGKPRLAGVSAFGLSGTNAHVVLEEAPEAAASAAEDGMTLLPLSAKSPEALVALAEAYRSFLIEPRPDTLRDVAYTTGVRRAHHAHRLSLVGRSREELCASLEAFGRGEFLPGVAQGEAPAEARPKVVFVYPGQGSQWVGMGRQLLEEEPIFRRAMEACDEAIRAEIGVSLLEALRGDASHSLLERIDLIQPALFAMAVALSALWRSWGVEPDAVVGHSMGEVAAAHVAGALTLTEAAQIICRRSRLLRRLSGQGAMGLIELSLPDAMLALRGYEDRLSVAVSNSPRSTVVSGDPGALDELFAVLAPKKVFCRRVKVDVASHSPQVDGLREELLAALEGLSPHAAEVPMHSTVTGQPIAGPELGAAYWVRNLRDPVLFGQSIERLLAEGHTLFVEMSPHPILLPAIEEGIAQSRRPGVALASLRREAEERREMLASLGALYVQGYPVEWARHSPSGGQCVPLPTYPFQRERYWIEAAASTKDAAQHRKAREGSAGHPLLGASFTVATQPGTHFWEQTLSIEALPYLAEHRVEGEVVLPGTAYIEMALAAAVEVYGKGTHGIEDLVFEQMLALPPKGARIVQVVWTEQGLGHASLQVSSRQPADTTWLRHATARVRMGGHAAERTTVSETPSAIQARCPTLVSGADHYQRMAERGLVYGPRFQGVEQQWVGAGEALSRVRLPDEGAGEASAYQMHPALLDACFQVLGGLSLSRESGAGKEETYVPVGLGRARFEGRPGREVWAHGRLVEADGSSGEGFSADVRLFDDDGQLVGEALGLRVKPLLPSATGQRDPYEQWLYALSWHRKDHDVEAPAKGASTPGAFLLWMDRGETGKALSALLHERGEACVRVVAGERYARLGTGEYQVNPSDPEGYRAVLRDAFGKERPCRGVVHLWSLDAMAVPDTSAEALLSAQRQSCVSALYVAQALLRAGLRDMPRLVLVTRGAQAVEAEAFAAEVAQAPLWGLGRTLAIEHPELECTRVDLNPTLEVDEPLSLWRELVASDGEDQVALRQQGRYVARLVRSSLGANEDPSAPPALEPAGERPYQLGIHEPGVLERLALREAERRPPGPGEVEIQVEAAGLNFLDVLVALGALPDDAAGAGPGGPRLGSECAGTIVAVGEGVTNLQPGQEVFGLAPGSFSSFVTTQSALVVPKPAGWSFQQAAATPIAALTAYYALVYVGRLRKGERVLIHAGAGGVGMAAIQLAQHIGAEVFATAGSEEKRSLLRSLGVRHVMDSRSLQFADDVLRATGGEGVDVVLNSLSGEFISASLKLLRDHGRFVEIGKRDYYEDQKLGLRPFLRNLSFSLVDLRAMLFQRTEFIGSLLGEIMGLFEASAFRPLPCRVFPISRAAEAFSTMAQARHVGKLVLELRDPDAQIVATAKKRIGPALSADRSYLISGGLGGLGLSVATWMVREGARHLTLVGRSRPSAAAQATLAALESAGATVRVALADVSNRADIERVLAEIERGSPPLRGVVHAAVVLEDRTALELSGEAFDKVLAPKVQGAWNLHVLTRGMPLDFFVMYSSAASLLGSPGQGNYAAANAFLDALAHHRRRLGLPGQSINWGAFSEVGLAAAQENRGERLSYRGIGSLSPAQGVDVLGRLLAGKHTQIGVLDLNLRQWLQFYPSAARMPVFSELLREGNQAKPGAKGASRFRETLAKAAPGERAVIIEKHIGEELGRVLRLPAAKIDRKTSFNQLGVDSLMSLELRNRLEASMGLKLSATMLFTYPNLASLAEHLLESMKLAAGPDSPPARKEDNEIPPDLQETVEALDKDALMALVEETMGRIEMEKQA